MDQGDLADAANICVHSDRLRQADKLAVRAVRSAQARSISAVASASWVCDFTVSMATDPAVPDERGSRPKAPDASERDKIARVLHCSKDDDAMRQSIGRAAGL
jgi:hypothetical protein